MIRHAEPGQRVTIPGGAQRVEATIVRHVPGRSDTGAYFVCQTDDGTVRNIATVDVDPLEVSHRNRRRSAGILASR